MRGTCTGSRSISPEIPHSPTISCPRRSCACGPREDLRNVIRDLLTVYLAGDVSSDTRALVEDWLQRDPELARQVELARRTDLPLFGLAAYVSSLPVSVTFSSRGFEGLLIDNWPERAVVLLLACAL